MKTLNLWRLVLHCGVRFLAIMLAMKIGLQCKIASADEGKVEFGPKRKFEACPAFEVHDAQVLDSKGDQVAKLENIWAVQDHGAAMAGRRVFWTNLVVIRNEGKPCSAQSELWSIDLKTKEKIKIGDSGDFLESPDGSQLAFGCKMDACVYQLDLGKSQVIAKNGAGGRIEPDGFSFLKWSKDGKTLWLGSGQVEGWSALGRYRNGIVSWSKISDLRETALNAETGWITHTEAFGYEPGDSYDQKLKREGATLYLCDASTKRQITVGHGAYQHFFSPKWIENDLTFKGPKGQRITVREDEIKSKLQKSKTICESELKVKEIDAPKSK
jgi:hypothetical protein